PPRNGGARQGIGSTGWTGRPSPTDRKATMMTGSMAARPKSDHRARPSDRETREGYRSVRAAARELGLSEPTVRRFIREGAMPAVEIGGSWRIPSSYFEALEEQAYSRCSSAA